MESLSRFLAASPAREHENRDGEQRNRSAERPCGRVAARGTCSARRSSDRATRPQGDRRSGATTTRRRPARLPRRPELVRARDRRGAPRARAEEPSGCWNAGARRSRPSTRRAADRAFRDFAAGRSTAASMGRCPESGGADDCRVPERPSARRATSATIATGRVSRLRRSSRLLDARILPARVPAAARVRARPPAADSRPARAVPEKRRGGGGGASAGTGAGGAAGAGGEVGAARGGSKASGST